MPICLVLIEFGGIDHFNSVYGCYQPSFSKYPAINKVSLLDKCCASKGPAVKSPIK